MKTIAKGIYPVMITPYNEDKSIRWEAVDQLVDFYIDNGCKGIFAVCQSSEMFWLTEDERVELAARVARRAAGKVSVVASGHISEALPDQIRELSRIAATGVDAVVMISCRLAQADEDDEVLIGNMNRILDAIPDVTFGMYECPYPYKRLLSDKVLAAMMASGRFSFIKDTCCDAPLMAHRVELLEGKIQLFNANCMTLLETLKSGAAGFCGIMANFHPDLLCWLYDHYREYPLKAQQLQALLSIMSGVERCCHPVGAKYHMNQIGIDMALNTRVPGVPSFGYLPKHEIDDLTRMEAFIREWLTKGN